MIAPVLVLALSQGAPTTAADAKADDPWPAILRCRSELAGVPAGDTARFQQAYECGSQAGRLAWSGSSEDRSRLWEVYDGLPSGGVMAKKLLEGFMTARLAEIVGRLEPARSPAPEVRSLEEARRLHASVERGYQEALKALQTGSPYGFQTRRELAEAAVELLRGRASPERTVERVGRLSPNPFSCLRTSIRDDPQAVVLMLAYLEQGRLDLAAGALLRFEDMFSWSQAVPGWDRRVLEAAGLDWEALYVVDFLTEGDTAKALGTWGSEHAVRLLLTARGESVRRHGRDRLLEEDSRFLFALGAFVRPGGPCESDHIFTAGQVLRREAPGWTDGALELEILDVLAQSVGRDQAWYGADAASEVLLRLCRPESRQAFRTMLGSPFDEVRARGELGLKSLGEKAPRPVPPRRVSFRLSVDGRPLAGARVRWGFKQEDGRGGTWGPSPTDAAGTVSMGRSWFVDPRNPVRSFEVMASNLEAAGDPWFVVDGPPPRDPDRVTSIDLALQSLSLVLGPHGGPTRVKLSAKASVHGLPQSWLAISGELPAEAGSTLVFSRLQRGREYKLEVLRSDGTRWNSGSIALGDEPVVVEASSPSS